jgi:hypothetical protein
MTENIEFHIKKLELYSAIVLLFMLKSNNISYPLPSLAIK